MSDAAERYARVHEILSGCDELRGQALANYLDTACGGDTALRDEIERMLTAGANDNKDDAFVDANIAGIRSSLEEVVDGATRHWLPEKISSYTIVRQIGQGGMGIVYEATQESPRRSVALKLLHPVHATKQRLRRFRREAELLGRLQHPGIAQIFEANTYDIGRGPQPFIAMELVDGVDLRTHCDREALDRSARIELLTQVCDAVQFAHDHGVVHRDLKPDNVLVNALGQPRVLDFGIARATDQATAMSTLLTEQGQLVGTLGYMAPEQLSDANVAVTAQADVYALGVLGFELLTGRLPRVVGDVPIHKAIATMTDTEAPLAGRFDSRLRGDAETILGTALAVDPHRRYPSARALAGDLRRFLANEPIKARAPSSLYLVRKFARRHKTLVGGIATTLGVAIAGAIIATGYAIEANARAAELERTAYIADIDAASSAIALQNYSAAVVNLDRTPRQHRGWEYDYLRARLVHYARDWETPGAVMSRPVVDPTANRMFAVVAGNRICAWDATSGQLLYTTALDPEVVQQAHYLTDILLHAASRQYAATSVDGALVIGNWETGEVQVVPEQRAYVTAWDTDGARLLYRTDKTLIWDGSSSRVLTDTCETYGAFHPTADLVALVHGQNSTLCDATTGEVIARGRIDDNAQDIAFSPDGAALAIACHYSGAFVLNGRTLEQEARLTGHQDIVHCVSWTADGRPMTASQDGSVRIWGAAGHQSTTVYLTENVRPGPQARAPFSPISPKVTPLPDGAAFVVAGDRLRLMPLESTTVLRGHDTFVYRIKFSPDGSMLASSAFGRGEIRIWDVNGGLFLRGFQPAGRFGSAPSGTPVIDFTADSKRLVAAMSLGTLTWDIDSGAAVGDPLACTVEAFHAALGRRQQGFEWAGEVADRRGRLGVTAEGSALRVYELTAAAAADAWRADEGNRPGTRFRGLLEGHLGPVLCVAISPDGERIATGGTDATVRLWDARTCEQMLVLHDHDQYVKDVEFSPDGSVLASASGDTTIRLWDTRPLPVRRALGEAR